MKRTPARTALPHFAEGLVEYGFKIEGFRVEFQEAAYGACAFRMVSENFDGAGRKPTGKQLSTPSSQFLIIDWHTPFALGYVAIQEGSVARGVQTD